MTFRHIIMASLVIGLIAGSIYGLFQQLQINPIIYAAEVYETDEVSEPSEAVSGHQHGHGQSNWRPEPGAERIFYTLFANILVGISFSILLLSFMSLHNLKSSKPRVNWKSGIVWGLALILCFFAAPSLIGIHPEIPGTKAGSVGLRQLWWLLSATATAGGLLIIYYAPVKRKAFGLALILAPLLLGPSLSVSLSFQNSDPAAVAALTELTKQYIVMTWIGMLIYCVLLGALNGLASSRFVRLS